LFSPLRSLLVLGAPLLASFRKGRRVSGGEVHDDDTTILCGGAGDGARGATPAPCEKPQAAGHPQTFFSSGKVRAIRQKETRMETRTRTVLIFLVVVAIGFSLPHEARSQSTNTSETASAKLTCSPAPCVLPPTQASEGGSIVTDTPIVTNPLNGKELLLGSDDFNCPSLGFHLSRDEGSTWTRVECMPAIIIKHRTYVPMDEPSVGYDLNGTAYIAGIYFFDTYYGTDYGLVAVQKSSDGTHWSKPVVAMRQPGQTFPYMTRLAVDSSAGSRWVNSLYVSGVAVSDQNIKNQVLVSHSSDGGASWIQVAVDAVQKSPASDTLTRMAVSKDGTVYVTWLRCSSACPTGQIMLSMSTDGGSTWSSPKQITQVTMPLGWELPNTYERVYNYPDIIADNSDGPYSGNLYVAMYTWTGAYLRVQVICSTDGGSTWSQPVHLAPKSDTHDQFFPAISVSSTGKVGVSWLDRRNDPNDIDYQAFAAISEDGGQSFGANWQLTTAFSNPKTNGTGNNWMGDYTGNTWSGDTFIAAWMDSSNGVDMQEEVGGVRLK
jgi:hypothetical protein